MFLEKDKKEICKREKQVFCMMIFDVILPWKI